MVKTNTLKIKNLNSIFISGKKIIYYLFLNVILITLFYFYQITIITDNIYFIFFLNSFLIIFFLITIYNIKIGLYIFIFLIPLLNFLPKILHLNDFSLISIIFLYLLVGIFLNGFYESLNNNLLTIFTKKLFFPKELLLPVFLFSLMIIFSSLITIYRYINFYPFITPYLHNLNININGFKANDAIIWVLKFLSNYLIGFLFLFIIYNSIKTFKEIIICITILLASTVVSSFVIIYQFFFNPSFGNFEPWITSGRFNATFTDPNSLGSFIVLIFPLILIAVIYFKKWYLKLIFLLIFLLFLPLIYFAGSRSSLIGIIISLIIFIVIGLKVLSKASKRNKSIILTIIAIILIFFILFSAILLKTDNKLKVKIVSSGVVMKTIETINAAVLYFKIDSFKEAIKSVSNYRYILWKRAFQMGRDYPLSGVGSGTFIIELPDYNWKYDRGFLQVDYPGNYYLQIFAEFGLPGLILLLAIYSLIIRNFINYKCFTKKFNLNDKNKLIIYGLFISFISMVIILFFGSHTNMTEIQLTFWLIIGLMYLYIKIYKEKEALNLITNLKGFEILDYSNYSDFFDRPIKEIFKEKLVKNKSGLISFIIILIIFMTSFSYNSCNNLSINIKQNLFKWSDLNHTNSYGFYNVENGSSDGPWWTSYDASTSIKKTGNIFSFALKAKNPDLLTNPLFVKIYIDNSYIKKFKLSDYNWHKYTLKLPPSNRTAITFTVIPSRTWNPKKWGISDDDRDLGVMVGNIEFSK